MKTNDTNNAPSTAHNHPAQTHPSKWRKPAAILCLLLGLVATPLTALYAGWGQCSKCTDCSKFRGSTNTCQCGHSFYSHH